MSPMGCMPWNLVLQSICSERTRQQPPSSIVVVDNMIYGGQPCSHLDDVVWCIIGLSLAASLEDFGRRGRENGAESAICTKCHIAKKQSECERFDATGLLLTFLSQSRYTTRNVESKQQAGVN